MNKYGSRKFLIALAALIVATWALAEYLIGEDSFRTIVIGVLGLYGAANVAQRALAKDAQP